MTEKRGPGRPRKNPVIEEEESRKLSEGTRVERKRKRIPIHEARDILTVHDKDPNKMYRWVRDYPEGNISRYLSAGYDFVINERMDVGESSIDGQRAPGNVVSKLGDPKHGTMLYLMCIDKDLYVEDQAEKQRQLDELDKQLGKPTGDLYGDTKVAVGSGTREPE